LRSPPTYEIPRSRSRSPSRRRSRSPPTHEISQSRSPKKEEIKDGPKPNFELSGKLAAETNTYNGVVLKYFEPPEARKPTKKWRLYVFKGDKVIGKVCFDLGFFM